MFAVCDACRGVSLTLTGAQWLSDSIVAVATSGPGPLSFFDIRYTGPRKGPYSLLQFPRGVGSLAVSPCGDFMTARILDGSLVVISCSNPWLPHSVLVGAIRKSFHARTSITAGGDYVVCASCPVDGTIATTVSVWDRVKQSKVVGLVGHYGEVSAVACNPVDGCVRVVACRRLTSL